MESSKSAEELLAQLADELNCPLCLELYVDPRILSCAHTFCYNCLFEYYENNAVTAILRPDSLKCPICRHHHELEGGDLSALPRNYHVSNIIHTLLVQHQQEQEHKVERAEEDEALLKARMAKLQHDTPPSSQRSLLHIDDLPDISDEEKSLDEDLFATAPPLDEENMHQLMQSGRVDEMFYEPASAPQVEEIEPLLPQIPTHAPAMSSSSSRAPTAPSKSSSAARSSSSHSSQPLSQPVRPPVPPSSISVPPVEPLPPHYYNVPASQVAPQQRSQTPRGLQPPPQHQSRAVQPHAPHRFVQPRISEDMYRARFRHWIESLWWAPRGFAAEAQLQAVQLIFVPHYLSAVEGSLVISGQVERSQKRWEHFTLERASRHTDFIVLGVSRDNALHHLLLQQSLEHFRPSDMVESDNSSFGEALVSTLKSWFGAPDRPSTKNFHPPPNAQILEVAPWINCFGEEHRDRLEKAEGGPARDYLRRQFHNASISKMKLRFELRSHSATLVFLPLYVCAYSYDHAMYSAVVNGINGEVVGDRPYTTIAAIGKGGADFVGRLFFGKKS